MMARIIYDECFLPGVEDGGPPMPPFDEAHIRPKVETTVAMDHSRAFVRRLAKAYGDNSGGYYPRPATPERIGRALAVYGRTAVAGELSDMSITAAEACSVAAQLAVE